MAKSIDKIKMMNTNNDVVEINEFEQMERMKYTNAYTQKLPNRNYEKWRVFNYS